jgi:hypothetical protein
MLAAPNPRSRLLAARRYTVHHRNSVGLSFFEFHDFNFAEFDGVAFGLKGDGAFFKELYSAGIGDEIFGMRVTVVKLAFVVF